MTMMMIFTMIEFLRWSIDCSAVCLTLVHCCTLSLCWDWVQGGNPLYAAVKCLSVSRGQIWQIFFIFFAKSTWHIHFLTSLFFWACTNFFPPLKIGRFFWVPPLFQNWGAFAKIEGLGCERILVILLDQASCLLLTEGAFAKIEGPSPKLRGWAAPQCWKTAPPLTKTAN